MVRIDYDAEQHRDYARGRAVTEQQRQTWLTAFAAVLPETRPLAGLDVGSGTGASLFQPLHEVIGMFTSAGWRVVDLRLKRRSKHGD